MTRRELDAAGVTDPRLRAAYARCRRLNARHGRTYFLATRLLPADRRPAVHALYGFARHADDIVDDLHADATAAERAAALDRLDARLRAALAGGRPAGEPVVLAVADTAARYAIDPAHFTDFMASMRSDLTVTDYATYADLRAYMHGSAAVIGLQMLPVLGTVTARATAAPHAAALGVAFQLTNFLRDVGEDLDRGRVYLPADLLAAHGADRALLVEPAHRRLRAVPLRAGRAQEELARCRQAVGGLACWRPSAWSASTWPSSPPSAPPEPAVPGVLVGCAPVVVAVLVPLLDGRRPRRAGAVRGAAGGRPGRSPCRAGAAPTARGSRSPAAPCSARSASPCSPCPSSVRWGRNCWPAAVCAIAAAESAAAGVLADGTGWTSSAPPRAAARAAAGRCGGRLVAGVGSSVAGARGRPAATLFSGLHPGRRRRYRPAGRRRRLRSRPGRGQRPGLRRGRPGSGALSRRRRARRAGGGQRTLGRSLEKR
ncbi:hypothetical protein SFUMM280S_11518 [Streptomyces fumanus]